MWALAPGEVRLFSVRGVATGLMQMGVNLYSYSPDQDNTAQRLVSIGNCMYDTVSTR